MQVGARGFAGPRRIDMLRAMRRTLALALWLASPARAAEPLRLDEVIERVVARGPDQAVAAGQAEVARAEVKTARMLPNPVFLVGAGKSEPQLNFALTQRLPIFGQRGAAIRAAERGYAQARAEAESTRWKLRRDGRVAYYAAERAAEEVSIAEAVEALTRRIAEIAAKRFEAGAGTRLEKEQGSLLHVRALQDVSDRRAAARLARLELLRLLGATEAEVGALVDPLEVVGPTPPLAELLENARSHHPSLVALVAEREATLARAESARAERRPVPSLEIGAELLNGGPNGSCGGSASCFGPRGALSFDLPILSLNGGPIARAEAEARLADLKLNAATVRVNAEVQSAWESFQAATARARFFDAEYVPAATSVEQMAREGFTEGKTGLLPLIEAERAVLEARVGKAEAMFTVQSARADLEEASGVPLSAP